MAFLGDAGGGHAMNGHQIYQALHPTGHFSGAAHEGGDGWNKLSSAHQEAADELTRLRMSLAESWKGEAAEAALADLQRYEQVSAQTATGNLQPVSNSMSDGGSANERARNQLEPMPAEPEEAGFWSFMPWEDSQEDLNNEWSAKNRRNIEVYSAYQAETQTKAQAFAQPFPDLDAKTGDPGDDKKTTGIDDRKTTTPSTTSSSTTSPSSSRGGTGGRVSGTPTVGSTGGSGGPGGGGGWTPTPVRQTPGTRTPDGGTRLPDGSVRLPDGSIRKPDGTIIKPDGTVVRPDGTIIRPDGTIIPPGRTGAAGYTPGGFDPSRPGGGFGPTGSGGFGPGSGGGAGGGAGGFGPGGGAVGGGFGPTGGGAGAGAGGALGAGKGVGAGGFGPGGTSGATAAKGGSIGASGRGGMGGMMGGAGGGRGQGGEDKEHQNRYYQKEELEYQTFEVDEMGQKEIDPLTGQPVVPPVIGER